jgi:hypothetical protein
MPAYALPALRPSDEAPHVLAGMQQTVWVPIENTIFALVKIALLLLFAWPVARYGIFASWTIPGAAVLLPVSYLIFRRLLPRHAQASAGL